MPINTQQPSLTLKFGLMTQGNFPSRDFGDGASVGIGHFRIFGFDFVPSRGAADTGGQQIGIAQNTALFSILGTTYGGNGQTTYAIPNLGSRVAIGGGQGPGLSDFVIGQESGFDSATLGQFNLPAARGGGSVPVETNEESLTVNYVINPFGIFPSDRSGGLGMIGQINAFAGNFEPNGQLFCDGRLLPISEYETLFLVIGTTYGGDGVETFGLPDLRGRAPVGQGNGIVLGERFGSEGVTLTTANLPTAMGGSGVGVSNYGPSLGISYLIATQGIFPSPDGDVPGDAFGIPLLGEVIMFAGNVVPRGFARAEGQLLPIAQNQALFSLYGTTYGGDGISTFALPDLRGRAAVDDTVGQQIGTILGTPTTILTIDDFPPLTLNGDGSNNSFFGGNQADTINGNGGDDALMGNGGNDILDGGTGNDAMSGGTGNDIYIVDSTGDTVSEVGGDGVDRVEASASSFTLPTGVENLEYTGAGSFAGTGNDSANTIIGGAMGDTLSGAGGDDTLGGEAGNDILEGGDGNDRLIGGAGADTMNGGAGNDTLVVDNAGDIANGGDGIDTVQITAAGLTYSIAGDIETISNQSGGALTITLNALANSYSGSAGIDTVNAGDGADTVYGRGGNDVLSGQGGDDRIFGDDGNDTMTGGTGNDILYGGIGGDRLTGNDGNDTLWGGDGSDVLNGSAGVDIYYGGTGFDFFQFGGLFIDGNAAPGTGNTLATADRVMDFSAAQSDFFDLQQIDANTTLAGDQGFTFLGTGAFTGVAGQLRYQVMGSETIIMGDLNGDGVSDFMIRVAGVHTLVEGNFFL